MSHLRKLSPDDAAWLFDPALQHVLRILGGDEGQTRVVGGAVRNALLGRLVSDVDLCTNLSPQEVMWRGVTAGLRAIPVGIEHGVVILVYNGNSYEVATLRRDVETDGRHAQVAFTADWLEDARRRDFTINAFYADMYGNIYDPLGGYDDLLEQRIRFIGDPAQRIAEDYLRILRFFRFLAEYGRGLPDSNSLSACRAARLKLSSLSRERTRYEVFRILSAPDPELALSCMVETEIANEVFGGVIQTESLSAYRGIEKAWKLDIDPVRRFLILACQSVADVEWARQRFLLSRVVYKRITQVVKLLEKRGVTGSEPCWKEVLYRFGSIAYKDFFLMHMVQKQKQPEASLQTILALPEIWSVPDLPWSAADLANYGVHSGSEIGRLLASLEEAWIREDFPEDKQTLQNICTAVCSQNNSLQE